MMRVVEPVVELARGLWTTLRMMLDKPVTIQYPEQKKPVKEKCIGCALCAAACPADAIFVESSENTDEERYSPGDRYASTYEINMLRCIYCGFCEDACPTEAIVLGDQYELSFTDRRQAIYPKEMLIEPVAAEVRPTPQKTEAGVYTRSVPEMKDPQD
jgi:NADH-quinone oxidoreductase subunit I